MKKNIILIGMPSAGKSTVGIVLAKAIGYEFIDSDLVIQKETGEKLHETISRIGKEEFNKLEGKINASINAENTVIATGGSAVYSKEAMEHFKNIGEVVFINLRLDTLLKRLGNIEERGISMKPGETIEDLYNERKPLYEKYADFIISPDGNSIRETMEEIRVWYQNKK